MLTINATYLEIISQLTYSLIDLTFLFVSSQIVTSTVLVDSLMNEFYCEKYQFYLKQELTRSCSLLYSNGIFDFSSVSHMHSTASRMLETL